MTVHVASPNAVMDVIAEPAAQVTAVNGSSIKAVAQWSTIFSLPTVTVVKDTRDVTGRNATDPMLKSTVRSPSQ